MGAVWQKNESVAAKRRCGLVVVKNDGSFAPRGTDFTGMVYICGVNAPDFDAATGSIVNQRIPLVVEDLVIEQVNADSVEGPPAYQSDTIVITDHGLETGDGPFDLDESGGVAPGGLEPIPEIWIIKVDDDSFKVAASLEDAYAGTAIDITSAGSGTLLIVDKPTTQRGLDGHFVFTATQPEANHDNPETIVIIHGADYDRGVGAGAFTTVNMESAAADFWAQLGEGPRTYGDLLRLCARFANGKFSKVGSDYQWRNLDDTKDSHHNTVTSAGRVAAGDDDLT